MSSYKCPDCKGTLNVNGFIVLTITNLNEQTGILLLSESLGDYKVHFSPNLNIKRGEMSHFSCPCCNSSLRHPENKNLVRIMRSNEHGVDSMVVFSSIYGEHSSLEIMEDNVISYGSNALKFTDPEWYLKT